MNTQHFKVAVRNGLSDPRTPYFAVINTIFTLATLTSLGVFLVHHLYTPVFHLRLFLIIEWVTVGIFAFEYIIRVWCAESRSRYIFSVMGVIDLASVLPSFLGLGDFTILKTIRLVRLMRFLRVLSFGGVARMLPKKRE